nr:phosphodiesterase [Propionibacterium sp.]
MVRPRYTLAHLTDLHLRPAADPLVGGVVDGLARTRRAIAVLERWDWPCDAWFFGGDLSDTGHAETYEALRDLVEPAARARGVRVIWAHGNHDAPDAFARLLLREPDARPPLNREYRLGGLRFLVLDSNVPGAPHGLVTDASLAWLAGRLASPAPDGTLLAVHHAPIAPVQDAAGLWDLRNRDALAEVVRGRDVRLILGGHFHQTSFATLGGVPVVGASSVTYAHDLAAGRTLRGQDAGQGFSLVQVYDDTVVCTAVPDAVGAAVHRSITPDQARDLPGWP